VQLAEIHAAFREPGDDCRAMMRWWWFGPDVRRDDVDRQLDAMARGGIGGVEVAYVYPLRAGSPVFLSPEFLVELRHAAERARELGLRFDLTLGSGWPFGGPHVDPRNASEGIVWERRSVTPGAHRLPTAAQWPNDRLVAAAIAPGDLHEPLRGLQRLSIDHGEIVVPPGTGPRQVVLGIVRPTGQSVKRAAAGAEGPVLNHYSADATLAHLNTVGRALIEAVPAELIGSFFCDSLEAYGANWTADLPAEFARRRGYDLVERLHLLVSIDKQARTFRADFHRTLTELFEERFVGVCAEWCRAHGVPFRIQAYGVPPARPSSFRFADRYEGEGWGWKTLTATRWASSAAHVDGKNVVSAEAWTWVNSPSFRARPIDLKAEAHEHFLSGVNQLVGHGWPYSPPDADGVGWFFYASGALDNRNAWWPAMPALMRSLQRISALLRLGRPVRDALVYVPLDDLYVKLGDELDLFKAARQHLPARLFAAIREHGRDFDLFDDAMIDRIRPAEAGVVIVASARDVGARTAEWLRRVVDAGGAVIAIDAPEVPGQATTIDELPAVLDQLCPPISKLAVASESIGIVSRRGMTTDLHLVVNTGPHPQRATWRSAGGRGRLEIWDPVNGDILAGHAATQTAAISLEPYQAVVIIETDEPPADVAQALSGAGRIRTLPLDGPCTVAFPGEEARLVTLPHRWEDDPEHAGFSGTARYEFAIQVPADVENALAVTLRFGEPTPWSPDRITAAYRPHSYRTFLDAPVGEVAEVRVNGRQVGAVWAPPYRLEIGSQIRPGRNVIEVAVSNTSVARLASDPAPARRAAEVRREYGERFRNQDIEHALDDVRSGLLCVPTLEARFTGE
jgi:hypothetical protein